MRTAPAQDVSCETLSELLSFCERGSVKLLIARCVASDLAAVHAMQDNKFYLMDSLIYYERTFDEKAPASMGSVAIRAAVPGDADRVRSVATEAFRDYTGHYHADPRLSRAASDDVYSSWAYRSCREPGVADQVLVAERDGSIIGFLTIRFDEDAEGLLFATRPVVRGQGVGRALMIEGMASAERKGARRFVISTQVTNLRSQAVWARLGFRPAAVFYTFHKWFDK